MLIPVKIDPWALDLLVDPLSKEKLQIDHKKGTLKSPYGRYYSIHDNIFDLRFLNNSTTAEQKLWKEGQEFYEKWAGQLGITDNYQDYLDEIDSVLEVYEDIPVEGRCLDVGGNQGRLRHYLKSGQEYFCCDPFMDVFADLDSQPNLLKAYPCIVEEMNFICCDAEFLPFKSSSFNTVHMRSVIDHFLSPEMALNEAYRVLTQNGCLIIGLYVDGGKDGKISVKTRIKEKIKAGLEKIGINRYRDYHVWHPTYEELCVLISSNGFKIERTHWQKGYDNHVCYVLARKQGSFKSNRGK